MLSAAAEVDSIITRFQINCSRSGTKRFLVVIRSITVTSSMNEFEPFFFFPLLVVVVNFQFTTITTTFAFNYNSIMIIKHFFFLYFVVFVVSFSFELSYLLLLTLIKHTIESQRQNKQKVFSLFELNDLILILCIYIYTYLGFNE